MNKIIKIIISVGILLLGVGLPTLAATPVNCQAKELHYNNNTEQIEASGDVKITYKDIVIQADTVMVDQKQNFVFANGNVVVTKNKKVYKGKRFIYNIKTGQGWMNPLTTEITDPDVQGPIYFKANDTLVEGENVFLLNSTFTGCNLAKPHYQLSASRIEYYPEDRLVFYHVWYWEHGIKMLYLPYMIISLKERDKNLIIEPGWSQSTGFYLYMQYNYFLSSNNFGLIKTNFTEKIGHDYGLEHNTKFSESTRFVQEYHLWDKKETYSDGGFYDYTNFDYSYKYRFQTKFGEKLSLDTWYQDKKNYYLDAAKVETPSAEKSYEFDLIGANPFPSLTSNYTESGTYDSEHKFNFSQRLNLASRWYVSFGSLLDLSLDGTYVKQVLNHGDPDYSFNYGATASKSWGWGSLYANYRETKSSSYYITNLKPDVTLTFPNIPLPLLGSFGLKTQYTLKESFVPNVDLTSEPIRSEGERIAVDLTKTINLAKFGSLSVNFNNLDQYRYTTVNDDKPKDVFATTNGVSVVEQFTPNFSTELAYNYTYVMGEAETYFGDTFYEGNNLDNYWRWQSEKFQANLSTGYAVNDSYIKPISFDANWNPSPKEQITMSTVYNIEQPDSAYPVPGGFGQSNLRVNYNPNENWRVSLSLGYNPQYTLQPWTDRQFEAEVHDKLGDKFRYELVGRYDFFYNNFAVANTRLFIDLHCRELMVGYDWVNNSYQLQLIFKSFPQLPLSLSPNAVGIMQL